jgi:hypothetical protein
MRQPYNRTPSDATVVLADTADASDHEGAAKAIAAGIVEGHTASRPGFWLHTGGTGILTYEDSKNNRLGDWSDKEYNDVSGIEELTHLPDDAFHRNVDIIVLDAGTKSADKVKTALVCPPTIYGEFQDRVMSETLPYPQNHLSLRR